MNKDLDLHINRTLKFATNMREWRNWYTCPTWVGGRIKK